MALTLKSSIGTPTANSYVTVGSANTYFASRINSDQWNDISGGTSNTATVRQKKEGLLIQATREIDHQYRYFGSKFNAGIEEQSDFQNLEFPRGHHIDADSNEFIKEEIKFATYEQALWLLERRSQRRTEEGATVQLDMVSRDAYVFLAPFVDRSVRRINNYPHQKSFF